MHVKTLNCLMSTGVDVNVVRHVKEHLEAKSQHIRMSL